MTAGLQEHLLSSRVGILKSSLKGRYFTFDTQKRKTRRVNEIIEITTHFLKPGKHLTETCPANLMGIFMKQSIKTKRMYQICFDLFSSIHMQDRWIEGSILPKRRVMCTYLPLIPAKHIN